MSRTYRLPVPVFMIVLAGLFLAPDALPQNASQPASDWPEIKINPASKARIKFESDSWEFGSIPRGSTVVHAFKFRNVGQDTLEISAVKPTCGCTTAPLSSNKIPPGGEGTIKAYFNSKNFNGRVNKQIYVDSNDPINPYLKVSFSAIINDPTQTILLNPMEPDFGSIKAGSPTKAKVIISNNGPGEAQMEIVEISSPSALKAAISQDRLAPMATAELAIELTNEAAPGEFKESVTIEAAGEHKSRFTIPCKAIITQ